MIIPGQSSRPCSGVRKLTVSALLTVLILSVMAVQVAIAQAPAQVGTERVSARTFRMSGPTGFRSVPDVAASGQVIVQLSPGISQANLQHFLDSTGTEVIRQFRTSGMFLLKTPQGQTINEATASLQGRAEVQLVSPDRTMYTLAVPNDPQYAQQWHWSKISAEQAWDVQTGSSSIVVAVIDSGVDLVHPDLAARIWTNPGEIAGNGIDDDHNGRIDDVHGWDFVDGDNDPNPTPNGTDDDGDGYTDYGADHGTHVAGIIGAATNNSTGVAGHDWNCKIMPVRALNDEGSGLRSDIVAAFEYAVANGADVINLSIGGGYGNEWTAPIADAVAAGVVVVAAAGNESWTFTDDPNTWTSPVCNDGPNFADNNVLGVGATDISDKTAYFTNLDGSSRKFVDVMAPGVDIYSTLLYDPANNFNNYYGTMSGTSMACPVVAGLASLVRAEHPSTSPASVIQRIRDACENIDLINPSTVGMMGAGRVNSLVSLADLAPVAPRSITAYDTTGDNGGSISVTWSKSADDGRGYNDVIGYNVYRSETGDAGSFVQLNSTMLPPGTVSYTDAPVADYTDYYYQVSVHDAALSSFTSVAGPAVARDDTAPVALTQGQLIAADVQGDNGGAIALAWNTYTPPSDFGSYRIWRADAPFTSIAQLGEPLAVITDPSQKHFTNQDSELTPVVNNKKYYYAVSVTDDEPQPNEIQEVLAVGPVVANPNFTVIYPPGLSMISIGAMPIDTSMGGIFGVTNPANLALARWNPELGTNGQYVIYSQTPTSTFLTQALGRGYWFRSSVGTVLNLSGSPAPAGSVTVAFKPGWNQLGNPYGQTMSFDGASVHVFGEEYSLEEANSAGLARDYVWRFDTFTNSYKLVSPYIDFAEHTLPSNRGFYFLAFEEGTLTMARPVGVTSIQKSTAPVVDDNHWTLQLVASSADAADTDNFIGVNPDSEAISGIAAPPMLDGAVDLSVGQVQGNLSATNFVKAIDGSQTWQVNVTSAAAGQSVAINWPDLSQVPARYRLMLNDAATGRSVNMRTATGYTCQLGDGQTTQQFEVVVSERGTAALAVNSLQTIPTGNGGAQIVFSLSDDAAVDVQIVNIAGRTVGQVAAARVCSAGANSVVWNARSTNGALVPAGRYLVTVTARCEDGTVARAIGSLQVQR